MNRNVCEKKEACEDKISSSQAKKKFNFKLCFQMWNEFDWVTKRGKKKVQSIRNSLIYSWHSLNWFSVRTGDWVRLEPFCFTPKTSIDLNCPNSFGIHSGNFLITETEWEMEAKLLEFLKGNTQHIFSSHWTTTSTWRSNRSQGSRKK